MICADYTEFSPSRRKTVHGESLKKEIRLELCFRKHKESVPRYSLYNDYIYYFLVYNGGEVYYTTHIDRPV